MTPGPVEEAGKVAGTFMDIMRAQPLSLALVIMNFALLAFFWVIQDHELVIMNFALLAFFWVILDRVDSHSREREAALRAEQSEVRALLAKCIVPSDAGR